VEPDPNPPAGNPDRPPADKPKPRPVLPKHDPKPEEKDDLPVLTTIQAAPLCVWGLAFAPDGTLATASGYLRQAGEVHFWQPTGEPLEPTLDPGSDLFGVAFSPDGTLVAVAAGEKGLLVYDRKGEVKATLRHPTAVRSVAFSPDGKRLASTCDKLIKVWDLAKKKEVWILNLHSELAFWRVPTRLSFSPDGKSLAFGDGSKLAFVYDAAKPINRARCQGHTDNVLCTAFSPDMKYLVSGSQDKTIKIWEPATGLELRTLRGHKDWVYCVAFAPDKRTLASAGRNGEVLLWDTGTGNTLATLKADTKEAACVCFSPDGKTLATSGAAGKVKLWDVSRFTDKR
jgi:WD40 repeat protein